VKIEDVDRPAKVGVTAANAAEELVMHFKVSDVVVHPAYGIGHIVKIMEKQRLLRYLELVSRLKQGSFKVTCEVVRDLTVSSRQKPLGVTARTILQQTQQRLCQEPAAVLK
jgi:RNA polymerase-interacting CarD/CdnL/TRCF family regulator